MTVTNTATQTTLPGNGATTVWPYAFTIPDAASAAVTIVDTTVSPPTTTGLATGQFSITGLGSAGGGSVTYPLAGTPLAVGQFITIARNAAITQPTALTNQGPYNPSTVEAAMDRIVLEVQQLVTKQGFAIQIPTSDPLGPPAALPPSTGRANGQLGFDATGKPIITTAQITGVLATVLGAALIQANPFMVQPKGGAYNLVAGDRATAIVCTGTFTVGTAVSAATLGNGYPVFLKNAGTGRITFAPSGGALIDGVASIILEAGEGHWIACDGANFQSIGRQNGWVRIGVTQVASASSSIVFATGLDGTFKEYRIRFRNVVPSVSGVSYGLQFSKDGGATFLTAGAYSAATQWANSNAAIGNVGGELSTTVFINAAPPTTAGVGISGELMFADIASATVTKHVYGRFWGRANDGHDYIQNLGGQWNADQNVLNAARILPSSGNIATGNFDLEGRRAA